MTPPKNPTIGPTFTKAARQVAKQRVAKSGWPYPYIYPPENAINVAVGMGPTVPGRATAGVLFPATLITQAVVMQYQVPNGFRFWLQAVICECSGNGANPGSANPFVMGDGTAFFTLDLDQELDETFPSGSAVKDFANVQMQLGCWELGLEFPLRMPIDFESRHILRWKITNVNVVGASDIWASAGLFGFLVPED